MLRCLVGCAGEFGCGRCPGARSLHCCNIVFISRIPGCSCWPWAECACGPLGSAVGSNLGRQAAPACAHRGVASFVWHKSISAHRHSLAHVYRRHENNIMYSSPPFWSESVLALRSLPSEGMAGAMRLLQKEEVREEGAGAVAREACAAEVSMSQRGTEAVELRVCRRNLCPLSRGILTTSQGLLVANRSAEKQKGSISTSANPAEHHHQHHDPHQHTLLHQPTTSKSKTSLIGNNCEIYLQSL